MRRCVLRMLSSRIRYTSICIISTSQRRVMKKAKWGKKTFSERRRVVLFFHLLSEQGRFWFMLYVGTTRFCAQNHQRLPFCVLFPLILWLHRDRSSLPWVNSGFYLDYWTNYSPLDLFCPAEMSECSEIRIFAAPQRGVKRGDEKIA